MNFDKANEALKAIHQEQLLAFFDTLTDAQQSALLEQIEHTDFSYLKEFGKKDREFVRGAITPIKALTIPEITANASRYQEAGQDAIRSGHLALVLLAGGMGTRLGFDGPKGTFNIGETKDVFIFQRLIENTLEVVLANGTWLHLFIMTSEKNDAATRAFFEEHNYFGYRADHIHFFSQDMAPVVGDDGKVLLEARDRIATSPNGNGGWFLSLINAGFGKLLEEEGIEWLNVFAVDNVLQRIADETFLGAVIEGGYECGSKVVRKAERGEKVGVMCLEDGRPSVVEYIEMTDAMLDQVDENGEPSYNFGVILNYMFSVPQLIRIMNDAMPVHFAYKKVAHVDEAGELVTPSEPNAWKFEYFILDMVHEMKSCLPYEVVREQEFAPIKNLHGTDSVDSARALCRKNDIEL